MNTHTRHNGKRKNYHRKYKQYQNKYWNLLKIRFKIIGFALMPRPRQSYLCTPEGIVSMRDRHPITGELLDSE